MGDEQLTQVEALLQLVAGLVPVGESVDGYRQQCIDRNYSPWAAERMAMELHRHLLAVIFRAQVTT